MRAHDMFTTSKPFTVTFCQNVHMKVFTTPNTFGCYENPILEGKNMCCFSKNP
jgi:hypothetical protein